MQRSAFEYVYEVEYTTHQGAGPAPPLDGWWCRWGGGENREHSVLNLSTLSFYHVRPIKSRAPPIRLQSNIDYSLRLVRGKLEPKLVKYVDRTLELGPHHPVLERRLMKARAGGRDVDFERHLYAKHLRVQDEHDVGGGNDVDGVEVIE